MTSQLRVYGLGLEGRTTWVVLLWLSTTSYLIRKKQRRPSDNQMVAQVLKGNLKHLLEGQHSSVEAIQVSGVQ